MTNFMIFIVVLSLFVQADVCIASEETLDDTPDRSSAEVEQILPCTEHVPDPRDFYASDSPILNEHFDPGQDSREPSEEFFECIDPEAQGDDQVERNTAYLVWFSYLNYTSQANWRETFPATWSRIAPYSAPILYSVFTSRPAFPAT
jgi:hypothetical protein